jgi:hypothetical protein
MQRIQALEIPCRNRRRGGRQDAAETAGGTPPSGTSAPRTCRDIHTHVKVSSAHLHLLPFHVKSLSTRQHKFKAAHTVVTLRMTWRNISARAIPMSYNRHGECQVELRCNNMKPQALTWDEASSSKELMGYALI